jgi:hypothetical protein
MATARGERPAKSRLSLNLWSLICFCFDGQFIDALFVVCFIVTKIECDAFHTRELYEQVYTGRQNYVGSYVLLSKSTIRMVLLYHKQHITHVVPLYQ